MLRCTKEVKISILLLLLQATVLIVECTSDDSPQLLPNDLLQDSPLILPTEWTKNVDGSLEKASKKSTNATQTIRNEITEDKHRPRQSQQNHKKQPSKHHAGYNSEIGLFVPRKFSSKVLYDCLTEDEKYHLSNLEESVQGIENDLNSKRVQDKELEIDEYIEVAHRRFEASKHSIDSDDLWLPNEFLMKPQLYEYLTEREQEECIENEKSIFNISFTPARRAKRKRYVNVARKRFETLKKPKKQSHKKSSQSQQSQSANDSQRPTQMERERIPYQSNQPQCASPPPIERERRPYQSNRPSGWGSESNAGPSDQRSAPLNEYDDAIKFDEVISSVYNSAKNLFGFGGSSQKPSSQNNNQR